MNNRLCDYEFFSHIFVAYLIQNPSTEKKKPIIIPETNKYIEIRSPFTGVLTVKKNDLQSTYK